MKYRFSQIAQNIRQRRTDLGLKTALVAAELGITERAYQNIENGQTDIAFSRLEQLSVILQITIPALTAYHLPAHQPDSTPAPRDQSVHGPSQYIMLHLLEQLTANQARFTEVLRKLTDKVT